MPVPSVITDLSTTAGSNSPAGTDAIGTTADDYIRAQAAFIAQLRDGSKNMALSSAGAASASFTSDPNTGIWSNGSDVLGLSAGGKSWVNTTGVLSNPDFTQPSFSAYRNNNQTSGSYVVYDTEDHDVGSIHASGVMTAPVTGNYLLSGSIAVTNNTGSSVFWYIHLVKNGTTGISGYSMVTIPTGTSGYATVSCTAFLSATDTVSVYGATSAAATLASDLFVPAGRFAFFTGYFLG